jgi:hypothetical protein
VAQIDDAHAAQERRAGHFVCFDRLNTRRPAMRVSEG